MNSGAHVIPFREAVPWIVLDLFHSETDPPGLWIDAEHFHLNSVSRVDEFARVLHPLRPAHLRDMDETFNTRLEFDEGAIVGDAGHLSSDASIGWKALLDCFPVIRQQLFVAERDPLAVPIKSQ